MVNRHRWMWALKIAAVLAVAAGAGLLDSRNAAMAAQRAPWCAYLGGFSGGFDCSYYTFDQCMATARGLGNFCTPNPRARYYVEERGRRRVRQRKSRDDD